MIERSGVNCQYVEANRGSRKPEVTCHIPTCLLEKHSRNEDFEHRLASAVCTLEVCGLVEAPIPIHGIVPKRTPRAREIRNESYLKYTFEKLASS